MAHRVRLWRVVDGDALEACPETRLDQEKRIERWIERDISVLSPRLLVIGRQIETDFGGVVDLLCMDGAGNTVVVELKRAKTPRDVAAQVLDYASWVQMLSRDQLQTIANGYLGGRGSLEKAVSVHGLDRVIQMDAIRAA